MERKNEVYARRLSLGFSCLFFFCRSTRKFYILLYVRLVENRISHILHRIAFPPPLLQVSIVHYSNWKFKWMPWKRNFFVMQFIWNKQKITLLTCENRLLILNQFWNNFKSLGFSLINPKSSNFRLSSCELIYEMFSVWFMIVHCDDTSALKEIASFNFLSNYCNE